jgi:hypothetical protein
LGAMARAWLMSDLLLIVQLTEWRRVAGTRRAARRIFKTYVIRKR